MGVPIHQNSGGQPVEGEWSDPAVSYAAVTKSDSTVLVGVRALYIGTGGDVAVRSPGSTTTVTFKNVADGSVLPIAAEKVMAATTAADIVALN